MKIQIIILYLTTLTTQSILSASEIHHCYKSKDTNCSSKLLFSLTLENGQLKNEEQIKFTYTQFTDSENNKLELKAPIALKISKSPVKVFYKLLYKKHFNSQIKERIEKSVGPFCTEGYLKEKKIEIDSTCGFKKDINENIIINSRGFCCQCPITTLFTDLEGEIHRGDCQFMDFDSGVTAHCVEKSDEVYAGYVILEYYFSYEVTVELVFDKGEGEQRIQEVLGINRRNFSNEILKGKVVGDFLPNKKPPQIVNKVLLTPSVYGFEELDGEGRKEEDLESDTISESGNVINANREVLVVPETMITWDGTECNKIGVDYESFQNQSNRCNMSSGSCLLNQISDIINVEKEKLANNLTTEYLLKELGDFGDIRKNGEDTIILEMDFNEVFTTQISLEIDASEFSFITNLGQGEIVNVELNNFEGQTSLGTLITKIKNIGTNDSSFEISLNCSEFVESLPSKKINISQNKEIFVKFQFSVFNSKTSKHSCNLNLLNSIGELVDSEKIEFETTDRIDKIDPLKNDEDKTIEDKDKQIEKIIFNNLNEQIICAYLCPNTSSLSCFMINGCSGEIKRFYYYILILFVISLFVVFLIYKCICVQFGCLICCFGKKKRKKKKKNRGENLESEESDKESFDEEVDNKRKRKKRNKRDRDTDENLESDEDGGDYDEGVQVVRKKREQFKNCENFEVKEGKSDFVTGEFFRNIGNSYEKKQFLKNILETKLKEYPNFSEVKQKNEVFVLNIDKILLNYDYKLKKDILIDLHIIEDEGKNKYVYNEFLFNIMKKLDESKSENYNDFLTELFSNETLQKKNLK